MNEAAGYISTSAECTIKCPYSPGKPYIPTLVRIDSNGNMYHVSYELEGEDNIWIEAFFPPESPSGPCDFDDFSSVYFKDGGKDLKMIQFEIIGDLLHFLVKDTRNDKFYLFNGLFIRNDWKNYPYKPIAKRVVID